MGPRGFTLPAASTASAKAARSAFFCQLCQKGYSRMNEFEAHESSYDHQHKKRLKEMKEVQKSAQPERKKEKGGPLVQIKLGGGGGKMGPGMGREGGTGGGAGGGFKKGGFKSAFGKDEVGVTKEEEDSKSHPVVVGEEPRADEMKVLDDSDATDEDYYDPGRPTGCPPDCRGRIG